ncbi:MAG: Enoyl-[acyl-carrier-protein] reductase [NADPH] FabL [Phycisphaerae bacterium]|nr:Enoyl-[acyl-carrier-protein] reductase [NADPH] FabL [Phycisphaerae bacterium]
MSEAKGTWALILGASSGFGAATAKALARDGWDIFGVHFDRRDTMPLAEQVQQEVKEIGRNAIFYNVNAGDDENRSRTLDDIEKQCAKDGQKVQLLLHSLAFGTLKPYFDEYNANMLSERGMNMTLHVMANTLVYWAQDVVRRGLMVKGGRIYSMTSSGGHKVWHTYGAVSAAKAALESHTRQIALELAPMGITANAIQAGVTDTPALRKIPGHEMMIEYASRINPSHKLTRPEDVADVIAVLADPRTHWMTGNTIRVDGGEDIVG